MILSVSNFNKGIKSVHIQKKIRYENVRKLYQLKELHIVNGVILYFDNLEENMVTLKLKNKVNNNRTRKK